MSSKTRALNYFVNGAYIHGMTEYYDTESAGIALGTQAISMYTPANSSYYLRLIDEDSMSTTADPTTYVRCNLSGVWSSVCDERYKKNIIQTQLSDYQYVYDLLDSIHIYKFNYNMYDGKIVQLKQ
jgi:hypothetical protein